MRRSQNCERRLRVCGATCAKHTSERDEAKDQLKAEKDIIDLKKQIVDQQIEKGPSHRGP